jgi:hypothetical protein
MQVRLNQIVHTHILDEANQLLCKLRQLLALKGGIDVIRDRVPIHFGCERVPSEKVCDQSALLSFEELEVF